VRRVLLTAGCFCLFLNSASADTYLVLPFFNQAGTSNLDWIGESLAEAVREGLSSEGLMALDRDDRVQVYHRLSIRPYSPLTKASVVKIGEELDAEHVIYGQFELTKVPDSPLKSRGSLQITARFLDLQHMKQGPEFHEVGAVEDLAALEAHLVWQAIQFVQPHGAPSEAEFQQRRPAVRLDAIENYVRGLMAANMDDKHRFFTQAARLDPHYSQASFELGRLLWKKKEYQAAGDWFGKVAPSDFHFHEATFYLGLCRYLAGDFAAARAAFDSVARVVPLSEVYNNLGAAQSRANLPDALASFRKALEGDPSDPAYHFNVAYALWKSGDFGAAADSLREVLDRDPNDAQAALLLARAEKRNGPRPGDSRTEGLERVKTNYEESAYRQLKALLEPGKP
jgi:tetratricopeptide (TPR) repeat protein